MKFTNWKIDDLIRYLQSLQSAPSDRLDYKCEIRCSGEVDVYNGERKDGEEIEFYW